MKKTIKKVVSSVLSVITLSTCVAFPALVTDAARVGRNTPHIHGQFVNHVVVKTWTEHVSWNNPNNGWSHSYDVDHRLVDDYCKVCGGKVGFRREEVGPMYNVR